MVYDKIDGFQFYNMVVNGSNRLSEKSAIINELNVFPVPDGDTGTNMSMTFKAAVDEIGNNKDKSIGDISKKLAKGALMGARGNSGVILSQIFRGISKGLEGKNKINARELAIAFDEGSKAAYKAVMRPTEGTILTVIREAAEAGFKSNTDNIEELMSIIVKQAKITLDKTPELLPMLKKAKVVDSGGMGLYVILKGMYEVLSGDVEIETSSNNDSKVNVAHSHCHDSEIEFGYCTEFIILGEAEKAKNLQSEIEHLGDSSIVVGYEDIVKVHIHTNNPGIVLEKASKYGELSKIKIDNMREEHREMIIKKEQTLHNAEEVEVKKYAFVSVAIGDGISNILKDLGVDCVIQGGQTMNPSTQDILDGISKLNAEHIFIFPNNKNIIMAANQAAQISEKDIRVIPTVNIPQCISGITMFNEGSDVQTNEQALNEASEMVKTASVTYAVKDTEVDGISIKEGNILGLIEGKINKVGEDYFDVAKEILDSLVDEESELITIFYGNEVDEDKIEDFIESLEEKFEDFDIQCYKGDQPLYHFIISVE